MKIEPEPIDAFGMRSVKQPPKKKINQKKKPEEQKNEEYQEEEYERPYRAPLGPPKEWEKVQETLLPYNMKNYQERLLTFLRRV